MKQQKNKRFENKTKKVMSQNNEKLICWISNILRHLSLKTRKEKSFFKNVVDVSLSILKKLNHFDFKRYQ